MIIRGKAWLGIVLEFPKSFNFSVNTLKWRNPITSQPGRGLGLLNPRMASVYFWTQGLKEAAECPHRAAGLQPSSGECEVPVRGLLCQQRFRKCLERNLADSTVGSVLSSSCQKGLSKDWGPRPLGYRGLGELHLVWAKLFPLLLNRLTKRWPQSSNYLRAFCAWSPAAHTLVFLLTHWSPCLSLLCWVFASFQPINVGMTLGSYINLLLPYLVSITALVTIWNYPIYLFTSVPLNSFTRK